MIEIAAGKNQRETKQAKEWERVFRWRWAGDLYRIGCLACSHFFSHNPSVLQSELFGRPGRWQIGLVKGAATIATLQPCTTPQPSPKRPWPSPQSASKPSFQHHDTHRVQDVVTQVFHLSYCLMTSIVSCTVGETPSVCVCVCVSAGMDGRSCSDCKPLQVVLLEWLWEQWGLNLPLQDHDQWACEHTHKHTLTHIHLGSQSSLNRPLTVACLAMWGERTKWRPVLWRHRLQTHAARRLSIHLWLTRCCESADNLLY